MVTAWPNGCKN